MLVHVATMLTVHCLLLMKERVKSMLDMPVLKHTPLNQPLFVELLLLLEHPLNLHLPRFRSVPFHGKVFLVPMDVIHVS